MAAERTVKRAKLTVEESVADCCWYVVRTWESGQIERFACSTEAGAWEELADQQEHAARLNRDLPEGDYVILSR